MLMILSITKISVLGILQFHNLLLSQHLGAEASHGLAPSSASWVWYHTRVELVLGSDRGHVSRFVLNKTFQSMVFFLWKQQV